MFCKNCGKNLPDNARFCDGCGAQLGDAPAAQSAPYRAAAPVAQANPIVDNFLKVLKGFFSKNSLETIEASAKSTTLEWILVGLLSIVVYAFALAANVGQTLSQIADGADISSVYNFGIWLLFGLLFGAVSFCTAAFGSFLAAKIATNSFVNVHSAFNVVAAGTLPLSCVYLANILLGFIWSPIAMVLAICGIIACAIYMYSGFQKLAPFAKTPYIVYSIVWAIVVIVSLLVSYLVIRGYIEDLSNSLMRGLMSF